MTTTAMCMAGVIIGLMATMATGNEFIIPPRGSSMHRLHRRESASFSHPSIFITKGIVMRRQPGVQAALIRAVASNAAHHQLRQGRPGIQVAMDISIGGIGLAGANAGTEAT